MKRLILGQLDHDAASLNSWTTPSRILLMPISHSQWLLVLTLRGVGTFLCVGKRRRYSTQPRRFTSGHVSFNQPSKALTNRSVLLRVYSTALDKFHTSGLSAQASRPETNEVSIEIAAKLMWAESIISSTIGLII